MGRVKLDVRAGLLRAVLGSERGLRVAEAAQQTGYARETARLNLRRLAERGELVVSHESCGDIYWSKKTQWAERNPDLEQQNKERRQNGRE